MEHWLLLLPAFLIDKDLIDKDFIEKYVSGFEAFRNSVDITPSDAEKITGLPSEEIVSLANIIGKEGPVTFLPGYGLQRHLNGGQYDQSNPLPCIITGNIGKAGAGFNYANLQSYVFDTIKEPESYYPDREKDLPFRRSYL